MKKPFPNTTLSDKKCKRCAKFLKLNLILKNPDAELCWKCNKRLKRRAA